MPERPVEVAIVGLGRCARVLARAAERSSRIRIVGAFSRSAENRDRFARETGIAAAPDMKGLLADPRIEGVILTVPNEQHFALALEAARSGKHVFVEKPIAHDLDDGLRLAALERQHGISVTVGHSARLMGGVRAIRDLIERGDLGRVAFMEANFSTPRALALAPSDWRWYRDRAPGGPLSQLAIHQFDLLRMLGGEIGEVSAIASRLSPAGAEVDDQSMTLLKFADGKVGYVGSCWTSPGVFAVRVFGSEGLAHYEIDLGTWDTSHLVHESATLYVQHGRNGYGKREPLGIPESDMFRAELEMFAESCASGTPNELTAENAIAALAMVAAALRSVEKGGLAIRPGDLVAEARARISSSEH